MIVRALRRVTQPVSLLLNRAHAGLILVFANFFDHSALLQSIEKAEYHPLVQSGAQCDVAQTKRLTGELKHTQNLGGVNHALNEIRVASTIRGAHNHRERYHIVTQNETVPERPRDRSGSEAI